MTGDDGIDKLAGRMLCRTSEEVDLVKVTKGFRRDEE